MPIKRFLFSSGCCRYHMLARSLRRCCDSIRYGIKSATIRAFRNWPQKGNHESEELLCRSKRRGMFTKVPLPMREVAVVLFLVLVLLVKIVKPSELRKRC